METQNETQFLNGLGELKQSLDANTLQLRVIQRQIEQLSKFSESENYEYLNDLLYPETRPGAKIPSRVPIPSTTFQLKSVATLDTNNKGNMLIKINPWVLATESCVGKWFDSISGRPDIGPTWAYIYAPITSAAYINYNDLDGINENDYSKDMRFKTIDMNQMIPDGLYSTFRVVSASARAKYIGPIEKASGICGGGISNAYLPGAAFRYASYGKKSFDTRPPFDPNHESYNTLQCAYQFTDFNNINHLVYSYTGNVLDGIRLLYFPVDNKYEEFTKVFTGDQKDIKNVPFPPGYVGVPPCAEFTCFRNNFWWLIYFQGLPVSSSCVRLELTINYELMPSEKYLNYMPISINPVYIDSKMRRKLLMKVASKAVTKNKDDDELNK